MAPLRRNTHKAQRQDAAVNLSATAAPRRRWAKVATYLAGVVSFPVLVVVTGAIVSLVVASVVAGGSEGSEVVPFLFWIVLTGIPVVLLLLRPGGSRLFGLGMLTCAVVAAAVTAAVTLPGPSAPARAETQLVNIAAHSSTPIYYAGRQFQGYDLDVPVMFSQNQEQENPRDRSFDVGDRLDVGYGSTCGGFFSGGDTCGDVIDIEMMRRAFPRQAECVRRIPGPRGTVLVRERFGAWDAFIGDVSLRVEEVSRQDMADLVTALRVAGPEPSQPGGNLPPPSTFYRRILEERCR